MGGVGFGGRGAIAEVPQESQGSAFGVHRAEAGESHGERHDPRNGIGHDRFRDGRLQWGEDGDGQAGGGRKPVGIERNQRGRVGAGRGVEVRRVGFARGSAVAEVPIIDQGRTLRIEGPAARKIDDQRRGSAGGSAQGAGGGGRQRRRRGRHGSGQRELTKTGVVRVAGVGGPPAAPIDGKVIGARGDGGTETGVEARSIAICQEVAGAVVEREIDVEIGIGSGGSRIEAEGAAADDDAV